MGALALTTNSSRAVICGFSNALRAGGPSRAAAPSAARPRRPAPAPRAMGASASAAAASPSPSELQDMIRAKNAEHGVVVYSKTWCPYCTQVKALLGGTLGLRVKAVELDQMADGDAVQAALGALTGRRTVPQVFVGGALVGGCDDTVAANRSGRLAEMLRAAGLAPQ